MLGGLERPDGTAAIAARHPTLGDRYVYAGGDPTWLFTENETNTQRIFGTPGPHRWVKDGINDYVVTTGATP